MKSILFIMLEIESASGRCVINDAIELANNNWRVDILSYDTKNDLIEDDNIHFYGISPKLFWGLSKNASNNIFRKLFGFLYKIQVAIHLFVWPVNSPIFTLKLQKKIQKMINANAYDVIVPVYTQIDPLLAMYKIKKKRPDIKCIAYYLDSLSAGPTHRLMSEGRKIIKGIKWENMFGQTMDSVIYMESSHKHHEKYSKHLDYYKKCVYLDIPSFVMKEMDNSSNRERLDKLVMTYVGSMPLRIRNPEYAFYILSKISSPKFFIQFVGPEESEMEKVNTYGLDVKWIGKVSHESAEMFMRDSDVLINIGNNVAGMVPSKLFEYIATNKPILSFAPSSTEPSIPYLEMYDLACNIINSDDERENVMKASSFLKNLPDKRYSKEELESIYYKNTPKAFSDYIESKA